MKDCVELKAIGSDGFIEASIISSADKRFLKKADSNNIKKLNEIQLLI